MRVFSIVALVVALLLPRPAAAIDEAGRAAARAAITAQAQALGRDDAEGAYAQAAPGIRALFPTAELFIGMVRRGYRPVYRHVSFVFGKAEDRGEAGLLQEVSIRDEDGIDWDALYSLERQPDGEWRITGCRLVKAPGTAI